LANSHHTNTENVAKEQHLIPRTYMRNWCYSGDSVWTIDKRVKPYQICTRNIENINKLSFHYDIKAGDLFATTQSLECIFGFLDAHEIYFEGTKLDLNNMNINYFCVDQWEIIKPDGKPANKKERNLIKDKLRKSRYTFIETEWDKQYEKNWDIFISEIERKVISMKDGEKDQLTSSDKEMLMRYLVMFDWRSKSGNSILDEAFDSVIDFISSMSPEFDKIVIPNKDRTHKVDQTLIDAIRVSKYRKAYYEFLSNDTGNMKKYFDIYYRYLTFNFCITDSNNQFITSDNPAFMFTNKDNWKEHILVALPTLLLSTCRTDDIGAFMISNISAEEVLYYNQVIAKNGELLILPSDQVDISALLLD